MKFFIFWWGPNSFNHEISTHVKNNFKKFKKHAPQKRMKFKIFTSNMPVRCTEHEDAFV